MISSVLPVVNVYNKPVITAYVNNVKINSLIDTGAESIVIYDTKDGDLIKRCKNQNRNTIMVDSNKNKIQRPIYLIDKLILGKFYWENVKCIFVKLEDSDEDIMSMDYQIILPYTLFYRMVAIFDRIVSSNEKFNLFNEILVRKDELKKMERSQLTTLCYIEQNDSYLMLHRIKKKEDVNQGKWIGVGGHFEYGESPEECLLREVWEETGLTLTSYTFRGIVTFCYGESCEYMCVYTANAYEGSLKECNEGVLKWVKKEDILHKNIWDGDRIFLPLLEKKVPFFSLKLSYGEDGILRKAVLNGTCLDLNSDLTFLE